MEENNVQVNEIDNIEEETTTVPEEASDSFDAGAMVAGIVGGFLAYAVIGGAKKLWAFGQAQWTKFQQKKADKENNVINAEIVEETTAEQPQEEGSDK